MKFSIQESPTKQQLKSLKKFNSVKIDHNLGIIKNNYKLLIFYFYLKKTFLERCSDVFRNHHKVCNTRFLFFKKEVFTGLRKQ